MIKIGLFIVLVWLDKEGNIKLDKKPVNLNTLTNHVQPIPPKRRGVLILWLILFYQKIQKLKEGKTYPFEGNKDSIQQKINYIPMGS
ncbi:MAG: hypothetical protein CM1200mP13_03430 [Candidatus Pelagibacterales bacterium]|nr:MAG: hypothetical protein CM1200mP13_03430 [Pelagibacterales bacterium]